MKFLQFETNSLTSLTEDLQGATIWKKIGSNAKMINLTDLAIGLQNPDTKKTSYILPVVDGIKANEFRTECIKYGIEVNIIEEFDADAFVTDLKAKIEATK